MKKILTLIVALVATATVAHAQFGIVGGLNFSNAKFENTSQFIDAAKSATLFHAGVAWKMKLPVGFALQPELTYQVKGAKLEEFKGSELNYKNGYIELGAGLQWGPDLIVARPYVFAQPFIGYMVNPDKTIKEAKDVTNKLEYGFGLGAGVEVFKHIQVSVQWFRNLGNIMENKSNGTTLSSDWEKVKDVKNYQGVRLSLGIFF
ncbi:MAG: PorT family protein [Bacteroidales bacterium]|nr:PorT family protein [Bacteroidales bacterium]